MSDKSKPFKEIVTSRIGDQVLASRLEEATKVEIEEAQKQFKETGKCDHIFCVDTHSWLYDFRDCYICGKGLGTV